MAYLERDAVTFGHNYIPDHSLEESTGPVQAASVELASVQVAPVQVALTKVDGGSLRVVSDTVSAKFAHDVSPQIGPVAPSPFADTVGGTTGTAGAIAVNGSVDVTIDTLGDHDWYAVTLVAGTTYTFQTSSDGSGTDAYLRLRDSTGALIAGAEDDDSGESVNSLISYTATSTGTYYVDAATYSDINGTTTGSYHLFVSSGFTGGDVGNTNGTATALAIGAALNGSIEVGGDVDRYAVNLVAGQTYIFRTAGTTDTTATDTILRLRDAAGTQLLLSDDAGEAAFSGIRFTATATGTYYLDVSGYDSGVTGAFNISAFTAPTPTLFTNDQIALQLTNGYWGGSSHRFNVTSGGTLNFNVTALAADGAALARAALALWGDVTGIIFNEVGSGGQLIFDDNQEGAFATASYSGGITSVANVNVGTAWLTTYGTGLNTYSFQTYIHEIGHALGLGHGGNYNGAADYASDSNYLNDSWATTIMSYFDQNENTYFQGLGFTRQFVVSPVIADAIAVGNLYGTSTTTRTGDTTYGFNNNSGRDIYSASLYPSVTYTVVDSGGIDTLDYSGFSQNQVINLNPETFMNIGARVGNVSIARGTVIENAIGGSGSDTITGNSANNVLTGNAGADSIYGNDGNDTINGEVGDAVLSGGIGTDTLSLAASGTLAGTITGFEVLNLQSGAAVTMSRVQFDANAFTSFTGTGSLTINMSAGNADLFLQGITASAAFTAIVNGSTGDNIIKGLTAGPNTINAGDGQDFLRGGQFADTLNGGSGNDKFEAGQGADILTGGAGADQFRFQSSTAAGLGAAADQITDYQIGIDSLRFALIDADAATPGDQAFSFLGTTGFSNTGVGQIRYQDSGAHLLVQVDVDGNGSADMEIVLQNLAGQTLTLTDFLL